MVAARLPAMALELPLTFTPLNQTVVRQARLPLAIRKPVFRFQRPRFEVSLSLGNSAEFGGSADLGGGNRVTFDVNITDTGNGTSDTFSISLSNGYSAGGNLTRGDIQIF
jgi:hypothetical protein